MNCLIKNAKSNRGGTRQGAGRKRDPLKDLRTGALTAQKILKQIDDEREIVRLYKLLNPAQQLSCIFKLRDSGYGRPAKAPEEPKGPRDATQINVNIRTIGA